MRPFPRHAVIGGGRKLARRHAALPVRALKLVFDDCAAVERVRHVRAFDHDPRFVPGDREAAPRPQERRRARRRRLRPSGALASSSRASQAHCRRSAASTRVRGWPHLRQRATPPWPDIERFLNDVRVSLTRLHDPKGHALLFQSLRAAELNAQRVPRKSRQCPAAPPSARGALRTSGARCCWRSHGSRCAYPRF
jgi:hypothetical protein